MQYELAGPLKAEELFRLEPHTRDGFVVPAFANLKAVPEVDKRDPRFTGTGIYGVLFRDRLVYVGILAGTGSKLFTGSVVHERWKKHLTFFTLRSPECAAAERNIPRILSELSGEPIEALASLLGGRDFSMEECRRRQIGFTSGGSTQFNKVRFAAENWDSFAPGNEQKMLQEISFVYARFLPETGKLLSQARDRTDYEFVKQNWLRPRETHLYKRFRPICNHETKEPNRSVDVETFMAALSEQMGLPLPPNTGAPKIAA